MAVEPEGKLKFLFVSRWGDLLDIAYATLLEGNDVKFAVDYAPGREIGEGLVPKVDDWRDHTDWADVVIFDYTGYGTVAEELRAAGKPVFGGTGYTDQLELDRGFGQEELKRHKVKILTYVEFNDFDAAIAYVQAHPHAFVIKPCGETQYYSQLLYVGKQEDGSDVIRMLRAFQKTWGTRMGTFQLQRAVKGVEVSVAAFFNGKEFLHPINVTFEHKKLFPKDLGVSTGEMGTTMFWTENSPIFDATLRKMEGTLAKNRFVGHIDINCIVNGSGIYPLEFTTRLGNPQIMIQRAGITAPIGRTLYRIAKGESFKIPTRKGFQIGAYMVLPPFPYVDEETFDLFSRDAVVVFNKDKREGVHPMHIKQVNGEWLVTGDAGMAVMVSATGITMRETQQELYKRIGNILINNAYYRSDIGDTWPDDSDKLLSWKYL